MADVFNRNPVDFVEMNDLFPVLNDKIGLTSTQWQKAIENTYYLKNHLGLADVELGYVNTIFTEPGVRTDVELTHREEIVDGKTIDYFDYTFYIPSPKIVATLTSQIVENQNEVGMELTQIPIYGTGSLSDHVIGYKFDFLAKNIKVVDAVPTETSFEGGVGGRKITITPNANISASNEKAKLNIDFYERSLGGVTSNEDINIYKDGFDFLDKNGNYVRPVINGGATGFQGEQMAYLSDIDKSIQQAILDSWEASY